VEVLRDEAARAWTGAPQSLNPALPFRVTVYNTTGEKAGSNTVRLT
jgi:hypothetical protein